MVQIFEVSFDLASTAPSALKFFHHFGEKNKSLKN
jgi:hypothetical protein